MLSIDQIRSELNKIAIRSKISGETKDFLVSILTYSLYHEQVEILNAIQESSLSTAVLMNSKIRQCMDVMYSVYRGLNSRVKLKVKLSTPVKFNKFDSIFNSNSFKVYAESPFSNFSSITSTDEPYTIIGILSSKDLITMTSVINQNNKYYLDLKINGSLASNLSEDLVVYIDGIEQSITRNFYEYIQQDDSESNTKLFILTLPDFGIRIFRRGNFEINSTVTVKALPYTTNSDILENEFVRINCPGTINMVWNEEDSEWVEGSLEMNTVSLDDTEDHRNDSGLVSSMERDNINSLLQSANIYSRLQDRILSKSDINGLFNEAFISRVYNSINYYDSTQGTITIFYVPKNEGDYIPTVEFDNWVTRYRSYFISEQLTCKPAVRNNILVTLEVVVNQSMDIRDSVKSILSNYSYRLTDIEERVDLLNVNRIKALIAKLPTVDYIQSILFTPDYATSTGIAIIYDQDGPENIAPMYYTFDIDITYRLDYEIVSQ